MFLPSLISPCSQGLPDHKLGLDLSVESEGEKWSERIFDLLCCLLAHEHGGCLIRSFHVGGAKQQNFHPDLKGQTSIASDVNH